MDDTAHRVLDVDFTAFPSFWERGGGGGGGGGFSGRDNPWEGAANGAAPFDQEFYIIMNVAVGGNFFPPGVAGRPWGTTRCKRGGTGRPPPSQSITFASGSGAGAGGG